MGRKIDMKKIQDNTKCQVTFSKRRASLIKKAEEISIVCDVDVAFLAFSPAGRVSKFCNRESIADFLDLYVNLPAEKRFSHMKSVQEKMEKLAALGTIRSEDRKLQYLNDQIENLKFQVERNQTEVKLAEANLRDFELNPVEEASLHQLSWCERNLKHCIEKSEEIKKEKMLLENEVNGGAGSGNGKLQMELEYLRNNEYKYPENIFHEMLGKGKRKELAVAYEASEAAAHNNAFNDSIPTSYQFQVPETQTWSPSALLQDNTYNTMQQPGNAFATNTYEPSQQDSQLWMEAPMPWQQAQLDSSFGNYSNNVTYTLANTCWEIPMMDNQPNLVPNHMDIDGNWEGNQFYTNNKENEDAYNEIIVPPPASVQAPISTSGIPSDSYNFLPFENPFGYASWNKKNEDAHMWD